MLTGKNKEQFEDWYLTSIESPVCGLDRLNGYCKPLRAFYNVIHFEMQIGVYLAYYDSLGGVLIEVEANHICNQTKGEGAKVGYFGLMAMVTIKNTPQETKPTKKHLKRQMKLLTN
jgi:hypothetical protein